MVCHEYTLACWSNVPSDLAKWLPSSSTASHQYRLDGERSPTPRRRLWDECGTRAARRSALRPRSARPTFRVTVRGRAHSLGSRRRASLGFGFHVREGPMVLTQEGVRRER